jgi:hypothetical protein
MRYIFPVVRAIITLVLLFLVFRETGIVTALVLLFVYLFLDYRAFRMEQELEELLAVVVMLGKRVYGEEVLDETGEESHV